MRNPLLRANLHTRVCSQATEFRGGELGGCLLVRGLEGSSGTPEGLPAVVVGQAGLADIQATSGGSQGGPLVGSGQDEQPPRRLDMG